MQVVPILLADTHATVNPGTRVMALHVTTLTNAVAIVLVLSTPFVPTMTVATHVTVLMDLKGQNVKTLTSVYKTVSAMPIHSVRIKSVGTHVHACQDSLETVHNVTM